MKDLIDDLINQAEETRALTPHQERDLLLRRLRDADAKLVAAQRGHITSMLVGILIGSLAGGFWPMATGAGIGLALLLGTSRLTRPEKP